MKSRPIHCLCLLLAMGAILPCCVAQSSTAAEKTAALFPPLQQWKDAVLSGNAATLKALYSVNPPAQVGTAAGGETNADADVSFWTGLKVRRMKIDMVQSDSPQPGLQQVVFQAELHSSAKPGETTEYISAGQLWQKQGETWRLVASKRTEPTRLQQPSSTKKEIYAPGVNAHAEIQQALSLASKQHKRVLVVFGANWCYDCHVLDLAFHRPDVETVLGKNFEVVHVDVGEGDKNQDLMQQYGVPMKKGIPAVAVLDNDGKLLYSQKGGEFEKARALAPEDVLAFLNQWKPATR
jgi:thioredoxin 1